MSIKAGSRLYHHLNIYKMKNQNLDPKQFLDATELSPLDSSLVRGGEGKKEKEKKKEVKVQSAEE